MGIAASVLFILALLLMLDCFLFGGAFYSALPWFAAPLIAFAGFLVAFLWYRDLSDKPKTKTKRRRAYAMGLMALDLAVCILAAVMLLLSLINEYRMLP